jgi:hypothetical protein
MQDSPRKGFDFHELAMLSDLLQEVLRVAQPPDEVARQALGERLGRLLLQRFGEGQTDRETLRSIALKAIEL